MRNWKEAWESLTSEELDNVAVLRVMECANGVVQHLFRAQSPRALSVEDTRKAMKFSMSSIKTLTIDLGDEVIKFEGGLAELLKEARDLYIKGMKQGDEKALEEFWVMSEASVKAVGKDRLLQAVTKLQKGVSEHIPCGMINSGREYLDQFL